MRAYERLLNYVKFETASDGEVETCPSTLSQSEFGRALVEELKTVGIKDAFIDKHGYVYASIDANVQNENCPTIGFIAHMDTVRDVEYRGVKPRIIENYDGKDIVLNEKENIVMNPNEFDSLKNYTGRTLIVTDGTTLLGADDKAGVAEIMTMAETLMKKPEIKHGKIKIGFTPDEEIGRGADLFDVEGFGADFAYTADGAALGEVEYETFNASGAKITFTGKNIHPGTAKNMMINASEAASEFISLLPANERPQHTEMYEGFYHLISINGSVEKAVIRMILRDHDIAKLEHRKDVVLKAVEFLNEKYGKGTVNAEISDDYRNMKEQILPHYHLIETAYAAVKEVGAAPVSLPVRGGTDGSRLSYMGLPCPNLGTGSHNHHGRMEYACAEDMDRCVDVMIKIAEKYALRK